jgi:hypothetical protein
VIYGCTFSNACRGYYFFPVSSSAFDAFDTQNIYSNLFVNCALFGIEGANQFLVGFADYATNVAVHNNTFTNITGVIDPGDFGEAGGGTGIWLDGCWNFNFYSNTVVHCGFGQGSIGGNAGIFDTYCNVGHIWNNHIYDIMSTTVWGDGEPIDLDAFSMFITVEGNYIHDASGAGLYSDQMKTNNIFRWNVVINCGTNPSSSGGISINGNGGGTGPGTNWIYNNTVIGPKGGFFGLSPYCTNIIFNNIFIATNGNNVVYMNDHPQNFFFVRNDYWNGMFLWVTNEFTYQQWTNLSGQDVGTSYNIDPLLFSYVGSVAANYSLLASSPLVSAGFNATNYGAISIGPFDFYKNVPLAPVSLGGLVGSGCTYLTTAASASYTDVQTAVSNTCQGGTVIIPTGNTGWNTTLVVPYDMFIVGAGVGNTIITNNTGGSLIFWLCNSNWFDRLSGIQFEHGNEPSQSGETIHLVGTSHAFRVDNCVFDAFINYGIQFNNWIYGCVDHCMFTNMQFTGVEVEMEGYGGYQYGDGSWADAENFGTTNALYFENNVFVARNGIVPGAVDGLYGARVVFRDNLCTNSPLGSHGTDNGGRARGFKQYEVYGNTLKCDTNGGTFQFGQAVLLRSGTVLLFSNNILDGYAFKASAPVYRTYASAYLWDTFGGITGTNWWDSNNPTLFASGNATGPDNSATLIDSGASFTPSAFVNNTNNFVLHDKRQLWSATVSANSGTTITFNGSFQGFLPGSATVSNNDAYEVHQMIYGLDMPGMWHGDLMTGIDDTLTNVTLNGKFWVRETLGYMYEWSNNFSWAYGNGFPHGDFSANLGTYSNATPLAGYAPLPYPHPLDSTPINVTNYGAIGDGQWTAITATAGSTNITTTTNSPMTAAQVGEVIEMFGVGPVGYPNSGTNQDELAMIVSVDGTNIALDRPCFKTITNTPAFFGTNNWLSFANAINANPHQVINVPAGNYLCIHTNYFRTNSYVIANPFESFPAITVTNGDFTLLGVGTNQTIITGNGCWQNFTNSLGVCYAARGHIVLVTGTLVTNNTITIDSIQFDGAMIKQVDFLAASPANTGNGGGWDATHDAFDFASVPIHNTFQNCLFRRFGGEVIKDITGGNNWGYDATALVTNCVFSDGNGSGWNRFVTHTIVNSLFNHLDEPVEFPQSEASNTSVFAYCTVTNCGADFAINNATTNMINGAASYYISNNLFYTPIGNGIQMNPGANVFISSNVFIGGLGPVVGASGFQGSTINSNIWFINNYCTNMFYSFLVEGTGANASSAVIVSNNVFTKCLNRVIYTLGYTTNMLVTQNAMDGYEPAFDAVSASGQYPLDSTNTYPANVLIDGVGTTVAITYANARNQEIDVQQPSTTIWFADDRTPLQVPKGAVLSITNVSPSTAKLYPNFALTGLINLPTTKGINLYWSGTAWLTTLNPKNLVFTGETVNNTGQTVQNVP